jgi:hypothetical protein
MLPRLKRQRRRPAGAPATFITASFTAIVPSPAPRGIAELKSACDAAMVCPSF